MADPGTAGAYGQLAGGILGGLLGDNGDDERERALAALLGANVETGDVAPDMRGDQTAAIDYLQQLYSQGGMDPQAKAALAQAQQSNAARERMARGAIGQNAAARGVGGSGVEIASQLANQQGAANRNSSAGTAAAADARTRAIQALMGSASIAGNVRGQDSSLAQFNAAQRLRQAGGVADQYGQNANAADRGAAQQRADYGNLGGFLGAAASGWGEDDEDQGPELLNW